MFTVKSVGGSNAFHELELLQSSLLPDETRAATHTFNLAYFKQSKNHTRTETREGAPSLSHSHIARPKMTAPKATPDPPAYCP